MNYGQIFEADIANGIGCRTSLFVSGCRHHCKGCFNQDTWNFNYGQLFTEETADLIIKSLKPDHINGLTILGGEPMEPENQPEILKLLRRVREEVPEKTIWIYSGYTFDELSDIHNKRCYVESTEKMDITPQILRLTDILVDGEFEIDKKDITLLFRGSSNQRVIDVQKSLCADEVILSKYNYVSSCYVFQEKRSYGISRLDH